MRRYGARLLSVLSALALVTLAATPAAQAGDMKSAKEQMIQKHAEFMAADHPAGKSIPPLFGTQDGSTVNIHSYEFQGDDPYNDQISDDGNSYRYFRTIASGSKFMSAPVNLPSGVVIDYVRVSDCINADGDFFLGLWDAGWGGGASCTDCNPGGNVTFVSTLAGCGWDSTESIGYAYNGNIGHPLYLLLLWSGATDGTSKFNGVAIGYHRVVSPAPGSPTFGDVPLSDPGFQYIEALVSSGITAGCGGGNYCPDNPLTRRQMAVFLAKAFGLHWPN